MYKVKKLVTIFSVVGMLSSQSGEGVFLDRFHIEQPHDELIDFDRDHGYFSPDPVVSIVTSLSRDNYNTRRLLDIIDRKVKHPVHRQIATAEALTKVVAYRDLKEGEQLTIPSVTSQGEPIRIDYRLEKVFDLFWGMPAFGFVPVLGEAPALLIYRGSLFDITQKRGVASILSDLDPTGAGHATYLQARSTIRPWLEEMGDKGHKTRVMGFSLGGALAGYTTLYDGDLLSKEPYAVSFGFNSPGMTRSKKSAFENLPEEVKGQYFTVINETDIVSKVANLYGTVLSYTPVDGFGQFRSHLLLMMSQPTTRLQIREN